MVTGVFRPRAPSLACEAALKTSLELIQSIFWAPYSSVCEKPALADLQKVLISLQLPSACPHLCVVIR